MNKTLVAACNAIAQEARDGNADDTIAFAVGTILDVLASNSHTYPEEFHETYGDMGHSMWVATQQAFASQLLTRPAYDEDEGERAERLRKCFVWLASNITKLGS